MINTVDGSLVIIDANTATPSAFWKGQKLNDLVKVSVKDGLVVLHILPSPLDALYTELELAGVKIRKGGTV